MEKKTVFKLMVPLIIVMFLAGFVVAETEKRVSDLMEKRSSSLKVEEAFSEATLSPLPGFFAPPEIGPSGAPINPPHGLSPEEIALLNERIQMWRMPYTPEELSRIPAERRPYTREELSRMPGEPKTYEEATNPPAKL